MSTVTKSKRIILLITHLLLIASMISVIASTIGFKRDGPTTSAVTYVDNVLVSINDGPFEKVKLPHSFNNLESRTKVTIKAYISPVLDDCVYIKTVYSPAKVYFDGREVFEMGNLKNYPKYMKDPATEFHMIETYGDGERISLKIDYFSPNARKTLTIHPPMVGSSKELIMERSRELGVPLIFSISQIISGIALIVISVCIILFDKKGELFLWLGLFSLTTGAWAFGENNFSGIIFRDSALLYVFSFVGMFTFIVPLLRFARLIVEFENPKPIWYTELFYTILCSLCIILQLTGVVPFAKSMYLFHILLPLTLLILTILTIKEFIIYRTVTARRFMIPISILCVTAFLELFNYHTKFTYVFSSVFQLGIILFLLFMGIVAALTVKDNLVLKEKQKQLEFEKGLIEIQLKDQKIRSTLLAENEQKLSQQRHDLRHHLTAINELIDEGDNNTSLKAYIGNLIGKIPQKQESFCENHTINAIINHYNALCEIKGIDFTTHLVVPPSEADIADDSLCAIFGNLLENAVEACDRMKEGKKFIKINSSIQYDMLTITMDNSFNGKYRMEDDKFISAKRDDFGIGIASIQTIARNAQGDAIFKTENDVFYSSVYLKIK